MLKQAFDLHKTTVENERQLEAQSQGTIVINHPNLEGETTETNPGNDTEELKQLPVSITEEKSEIKDEWRLVKEKAKPMEEATDMQLHDSAKESMFLKFITINLVFTEFHFDQKFQIPKIQIS